MATRTFTMYFCSNEISSEVSASDQQSNWNVTSNKCQKLAELSWCSTEIVHCALSVVQQHLNYDCLPTEDVSQFNDKKARI